MLLRDIASGSDPQAEAVIAILTEADADIVALQGIDFDMSGEVLSMIADRADYPHHFALRPNTGRQTGLDLDGDGRVGGPGDAQGFGYFAGQGGMAVLSRFPIRSDRVRDFSELLWKDLPGALLTLPDGTPLLSEAEAAVQRLSTTGHWLVPVELDGGQVAELLMFHASPPDFDGPEDRNGRRNHDEIRFWTLLLDGAFGAGDRAPFLLLGDFNLDPLNGEGIRSALTALLSDPRLQDPRPTGAAGAATVDWPDPEPGDLRVDYVLPSAHWRISDSGVMWWSADDPRQAVATAASRHRLVWADIELP